MLTKLTTLWNRIKTFAVDAGAVALAFLTAFVWWKERQVSAADAKVTADQKKIATISQDETNLDAANTEEQNKRIGLEQQLEKDTNDTPTQDDIVRIINTPNDQQ